MGLRPGDVVALTVCRLVAKKSVDVLLDAVAALQHRVPTLRFLVVGDGPRRRACEARWASDMFVLASRESCHGLSSCAAMKRRLRMRSPRQIHRKAMH
ncbi:MAG: glycosyltransferase [Variovorax sp.]|nr:MAG: glycosyltransferase [Variovorax sp.]